MHVVLVRPEIAPNTGNIIRLCANTGARLHLIEPLGFRLDDRLLRRGGLDYHEYADVDVWPSYEDFERDSPAPRWAFSSHGRRRYDDVRFGPDDVFVFGAERAGLPSDVRDRFSSEDLLTIPMRPGNRSLNLANAVSIVLYEAWRQQDFPGAAGPGTRTGITVERLGLDDFDS